jgi:hypothetical protein
LIDLLNMQAGVEAHGELFLDRPRLSPPIAGCADYRRFVEVHGTPGLTRVPRVFSYLNELYRAPRTVGFKLMYAQLRKHPEILAYMAVRRLRVVHLMRRNYIDVIVSEELAKLTGTSHARAGTRTEVPLVYLNPATLVDQIRRLSRRSREARRLIRLSTCAILETTYEELLEGEREFVRILRFLGVSRPATQMQSHLAKRGTRSHRDAIANYAEVEQALNSTPFSRMLR